MSLRNKLILLFVGLAIIPLLVLAAYSNWHAQNLLENMVQAQLQERGSAFSRHLAETRVNAEVELQVMAVDLASYGVSGGVQAPKLDSVRPGPLLSGATYLRFRHATGRIWMLSGTAPEEATRCSEQGGSRIIEISTEVGEEGLAGTLTAGIWASELFFPEGFAVAQSVHVINQVTREAIFSGDCDFLQGTPWVFSALDQRLGLLEGGGSDTFHYTENGESGMGVVTAVHGTDWSVVASSPPIGVASSLDRIVLAYWVFVLGLAITTAAAFSLLIGRFTRSLQELARAAEEIGTGELDPWLPLPTSGEIGQLTLAFNRMLTRIRQMMLKVDQSGRLAVVGQLSAYLAHEIRNPLSSIKLNLQRLQRWAKSQSIPEFCLEPIEISLKEVERLSASVSGVLELSSAPDSPLEVVSLHGLVEEASDLLSARFRRQGVALSLSLDATADRVLARVGQIKSVTLNLMVNALEAQPDGGHLEIHSRLSRSAELGGPVVALHFKDGGTGIPPEVRDRIFEPFFTTKPGGSGIGLAMASQAIQDCMGDLYLEPSLAASSGAGFVIVLPLAPVEQVREEDASHGSKEWRGVPRHWQRGIPSDGSGHRAGTRLPAHLMTPEGLKAVLSLAKEDPEDLN